MVEVGKERQRLIDFPEDLDAEEGRGPSVSKLYKKCSDGVME